MAVCPHSTLPSSTAPLLGVPHCKGAVSACPLVGWSRARGGGGTAGFSWLWPHACCNPTSPSAAKRVVISAKTVIRLLGTNLSQNAKQEGRTSDQPFYTKLHRGKWKLGEDRPCQVFLCCVPLPYDISASHSRDWCCSASQLGCASPSQWGWSCSLSHLWCCTWVALCPQSAFPRSDKTSFIHCCVLTTGQEQGLHGLLGGRGNAAWCSNPSPKERLKGEAVLQLPLGWSSLQQIPPGFSIGWYTPV